MTSWYRFVTRVLQAWTRCMLELTDLIWGLGDLPDAPPRHADFVDLEYFEMLDREGRP